MPQQPVLAAARPLTAAHAPRTSPHDPTWLPGSALWAKSKQVPLAQTPPQHSRRGEAAHRAELARGLGGGGPCCYGQVVHLPRGGLQPRLQE